jgi:hypothetical protein
MDVDAAGAGRVLLADEALGAAVALAAVSPVAMTAVPVAATPPIRPFVVLLAYGALVDEMTPVEFMPLAVTLPVESDKPVAKIEVDEVVTLVRLVVTFVAVALLFHVNGGWVEVVGNVELRAAVVTATAGVLVGYAVSPSTLVGMGKVVMLVKYDFFVADVFGIEVISDVDVSCLGRTAALTETIAKAIELRRRNCIFDESLLCVWDVSLMMMD